jgi:Fic family protein
MKKLINDFDDDINRIEAESVIHPFFIAAKYSNDFVQIHPFEDGNGRMSRLNLNTILLKYAGVLVSIGETAEYREEYLGIMTRAGTEMWGGAELAALSVKRAAGALRKIRDKLRRNKESSPQRHLQASTRRHWSLCHASRPSNLQGWTFIDTTLEVIDNGSMFQAQVVSPRS